MELIILGHIIGDFYVQTNKIAEKKQKSIKYMLLHCFIYSLILGICFYLLDKKVCHIIEIVIVIFATHVIVDFIKKQCDKKYDKHRCIIFIADQLIHFVILIAIYYIIRNSVNSQFMEEVFINNMTVRACIIRCIVILICYKPAAVFVSLMFEKFAKHPKLNVNKKNKSKKSTSKIDNVNNENVRVGYWIGVLEREIILLLGLLGQYGAIGFVLTAKSLARYRQLEDKEFAEKYLVGTLLSAFISILCIAMCSMEIHI